MKNMPKKSPSYGFVLAFFVLALSVVLAHAQSVPSQLNTGYPENGLFHGSEIDNVQINNGGLHVEIPVSTTKGRGLSASSKVVYNSKGWTFRTRCFTSGGGFCEDDVQGDPLGYPTLAFFGAFDYQFSIKYTTCTAGFDLQYTKAGGYTLREPDGTKHHFAPDPAITQSSCVPPHYTATLYADDASGWIMQTNTSDGSIIQAISKNGTRILPSSGISGGAAALIVDANGNQMQPSGACCALTGVGGTDTLGRPIPANGAYYDSSGTLQTPTFSGSVSVVIDTTPLCDFATADSCVPDKSTWTLPAQLNLPNGEVFTFTYAQNAAGELASMTLPTGGKISWTWGAWDTGGRNVATRTVSADGVTVTGKWSYNLSAGGIVTDPANKDTVYTCLIFSSSCNGVARIDYYDGPAGASTLLKTVTTDYMAICASCGTADPAAVPIRETTTWPQQNLKAITETDWDTMAISGVGTVTWRNPIEKRVYDWAATSASPTLLQRTHISYRHLESTGAAYLTANIADLPTLTQTYDGVGNLMAQTQNTYDGSALTSTNTGTCQAPSVPGHDYCNYSPSNLVRGNATQVSRWLNTNNSWLSTNNTYDDLGNPRTTTDPLGHQTSFDYTDNWAVIGCVTAGATFAFPTTVTNAKGQRKKTSFFPCTSLIQSVRDENDIVAGRSGTTNTYDSMNRPLVTQTLDSGGQILAKISRGYNDTVLPLSITKTVTGTPSPDVVSTVTMDGLGRTAQTILNDPEGNVTSEITYDALGRESAVTNPHRSVVAATDGATQYFFDTLGRTTSVTKPDGNSIRTDYAGNVTTTTDETGRQRSSRTDGAGRLVEVDEPGNPSTFVANNYSNLAVDGNFAVFGPANDIKWQTNTHGATNTFYSVNMMDDGNLIKYTPTWNTATPTTSGTATYGTQACVGYRLFSGQTLASGACLQSLNKRFMLVMQTAGNLVLYDLSYSPAHAIFSNNTTGVPGSYLAMQTDGNLVIYTASGSPVWSTGSVTGTGSYMLQVQDPGNLVIYKDIWETGTSQPANGVTNFTPVSCSNIGNSIALNQNIPMGSCLISNNGRFALLMQTDGNLVVYDRSVNPLNALWNTGTGVVATPMTPGVAMPTLYSYDALGNLLCVEQHGNVSGTGCSSSSASDATSPWRVRRFTYDSLSRLLTAKNPESGTTTYQYDNDGNMISKVDGRGIGVTFGYEQLHRLTIKQYSDGSAPREYYYDVTPPFAYSAPNHGASIGRLTHASNDVNAAYDPVYDPLGRVTAQVYCIPSNCANYNTTVSASYDAAGAMTSLTYPDGRKVTSSYSAAGRMTGVTLASFAGTSVNATYYTVPQGGSPLNWGYWPTGAMNRGTYGNGVIETTGYNNRSQITSIIDAKGASTLFSKTYSYADASGYNNGNILSIGDALSSTRNQTFSYDPLNRILTGSQADNAFNITYSYDAWGNMKESGTSNFQPVYDLSNRIQSPPNCSPVAQYCYDAAGDLLIDNKGHAYTYDAESRIKSVDGAVATYTYGPDGERVRKDANGVATEYVYFQGNAIAEKNPNTGAWTDYIFGYGKRLAKDTSTNGTGAQYYQDDHLGSARIMTDSAGTVISNCTFNPFGEQVGCSPDNPSNHYRFTGKERDAESNLDDFGARYFSSSMGRWMTPDWSARPVTVPYAVFGDPQSLNLYLYVRNDPVSVADADGHVAGGCAMFMSCMAEWVEGNNNANKNSASNQSTTTTSTQDALDGNSTMISSTTTTTHLNDDGSTTYNQSKITVEVSKKQDHEGEILGVTKTKSEVTYEAGHLGAPYHRRSQTTQVSYGEASKEFSKSGQVLSNLVVSASQPSMGTLTARETGKDMRNHPFKYAALGLSGAAIPVGAAGSVGWGIALGVGAIVSGTIDDATHAH
jgi:RHS repeat-associated protein